MTTEIERAVEFYKRAAQAEEQKRLDVADIYYLKSADLFQQVGKAALAESDSLQSRASFEEAAETSGIQYLSAAKALNALTFLRWSRKNYEGALHSAKESVKMMEAYGTQFITSADADFIYSTSYNLLDQMQYEMSLAGIRSAS